MDAPIFLLCKHCGNLAEKIIDKGTPVECCGEPMEELAANTSDGAREKHVPACTADGGQVCVRVGGVPHPMLPEHHIGWIELHTRLGRQRRRLKPGDEPSAFFSLAPGDEVTAVYEWCSLHGLWKAEP